MVAKCPVVVCLLSVPCPLRIRIRIRIMYIYHNLLLVRCYCNLINIYDYGPSSHISSSPEKHNYLSNLCDDVVINKYLLDHVPTESQNRKFDNRACTAYNPT